MTGIRTQIGADVNLTSHLADVVPRTQVQDVELYDSIMGKKRKFAFCTSTINCTLEKIQSPPVFCNRLKQQDSSILLTGIQKDDEGFEIEVKIHFKQGRAPRSFTLRILIDTQQEPQQGGFLLEIQVT